MEPPPPPWHQPSSHLPYHGHSYSYQDPTAYAGGPGDVGASEDRQIGDFHYPYPLAHVHQPPYGYQPPPEPSHGHWSEGITCVSGQGGPLAPEGFHGKGAGGGGHEGDHLRRNSGRLLPQGEEKELITPSVDQPEESVWVTDSLHVPDFAAFGQPGGQSASLSHSAPTAGGNRYGSISSQCAGFQGDRRSSSQGIGMQRYHPPPARRSSPHDVRTASGHGVGVSAVELLAAENFARPDTEAKKIREQHSDFQSSEDPVVETSRVAETSPGHYSAATCSSTLVSSATIPDTVATYSTSAHSSSTHSFSSSLHGSKPDSQGPLSTGNDKRKEVAVQGEREKQKARLEYQNSFLGKVQRFVARHAEAFDELVKESSRHPSPHPPLVPHNSRAEESFNCGQPDALEYHMQVSTSIRRQRFFELVSVGDIVMGHVTARRAGGLSVTVTSITHGHKLRELSDLDVKGVVPSENLADTYEKKEQVLSETELDDVVQAVVVAVYRSQELLDLSFLPSHLLTSPSSSSKDNVQLGYLEGKRPRSPRPGHPDPVDFLHQLEDDPGFCNPHSVENLKSALGISPFLRPSLLRKIQLAEYRESDYYDSLRKVQRGKWSMDTVAIGVKYFKSGAQDTAMKYLSHALDIDAENVEGLVARGALLATTAKYREAIKDFEAALTLKHSHKNARKYLVDTEVAYGRELERKGDLDTAMHYYREALADNPEEETAKRRLQLLLAAKERQAAEQREREQKKAEEKATLKKLQKIIEHEREKGKKAKKRKHKTKKRTHKATTSKKGKQKISKKGSRRRPYSSDEETESTVTASSGYSDTDSASERSRSHTPRSSSSSPLTGRGRKKKSKSKRRKESYRSRSRSRTGSASPSRMSKGTKGRREKGNAVHRHSRPRLLSRSRSRTRSRSRSP